MSLNFSRQTFFAVFLPLTLVAGLFWLSEIRGYRAEMTLFVLPKTEYAKGAAHNLAALAREVSFANGVYQAEIFPENPLLGLTPSERRAFWQKKATIITSGQSDLIRISVGGADQREALDLANVVLAEIVSTGSRYYNQKTDIDLRVVEEAVAIPSFTAWPRFVVLTLASALFFTLVFFAVYGAINQLFPKKHIAYPGTAEYAISPDTFKPRVPTYWNQGEGSVEMKSAAAASLPDTADEPEAIQKTGEQSEEQAFESDFREYPQEEVSEYSTQESRTDEEYIEPAESVLTEEVVTPTETVTVETVPEEKPEDIQPEESYVGYVEHAAAPDNLPVFDGPITPLQGAQARLMKLDIDANRALLSSDETVEEIDRSTPKTHEPTPEEYKRRLNDLLSGKM